MGNANSSADLTDGTGRVTEAEKRALTRFTEPEIHVMREMYRGITHASSETGVNKASFLKIFPLPGLLGERLFAVFDKNASGAISFYELVAGLAVLCRGSREEKLKFIFDLYDVTERGAISKRDMITMIHQFPQSAMCFLRGFSMDPNVPASEVATDTAFELGAHETDSVEKLVDEAFSAHAKGDSMAFPEFLKWCNDSPLVSEFLMSILPVETSEKSTGSKHAEISPLPPVKEVPPMTRRNSSSSVIVRTEKLYSFKRTAQRDTKALLLEAKKSTSTPSVVAAIEAAIAEVDKVAIKSLGKLRIKRPSVLEVVHQGCLWKKGTRLKQMKKRYYLLKGNFLYYFLAQDDTRPKGVIFISGRYVEAKANSAMEKQGFFEIEMSTETGDETEKRYLYARSKDECHAWVASLKQATCKLSIDEYYALGRELGHGRFSRVLEATHRTKNVKCAVKIMDKTQLGAQEKELLRTEIAILRLVKHKHIIRLYDVFESKQNIYIVTELLTGGELFTKIVGRVRHSEAETKAVMRPLFESVAYLHKMGIAHRDIKPENILCGDNLTDLRIADFGLSKLAHPHEIMTMPCGTLSYCAPEVLAQSGYGKEADIWSLGVIMYLLLRGELPYFGKTKQDIIQKTLHAEIDWDGDAFWGSISTLAKDLLTSALTKVPAKRISAAAATQHPWFQAQG
ncbi:CAMK/CAMK1 protein kinase [Saprolegnia diclina VS20]|uniref:CAMK/CAMK1 protein kinase n=1 Tax=Saprolegnia diclina (strain VS20) TaxID=1156394 RepID=T0QT42_SAPDV|nr:CAMK/CAMK1 protein kinase [Saprolegnia diclina VS20]EQC37175.1 CAMK/CAMK1 protein kinase [Saprolegnia diclina VS20]|eukprot:XP_008609337.1 CAMK/CAMK1 protein kinase [Saprolegnia diclina VS20]